MLGERYSFEVNYEALDLALFDVGLGIESSGNVAIHFKSASRYNLLGGATIPDTTSLTRREVKAALKTGFVEEQFEYPTAILVNVKPPTDSLSYTYRDHIVYSRPIDLKPSEYLGSILAHELRHVSQYSNEPARFETTSLKEKAQKTYCNKGRLVSFTVGFTALLDLISESYGIDLLPLPISPYSNLALMGLSRVYGIIDSKLRFYYLNPNEIDARRYVRSCFDKEQNPWSGIVVVTPHN